MALIPSDKPHRSYKDPIVGHNSRTYKINQAIPGLGVKRYRQHARDFKLLTRAKFLGWPFKDPLVVEKFIARHYID